MPSPLAHAAAAYAVHLLMKDRLDGTELPSVGPIPPTLTAAIGFSFLPDIDSAIGFATGNFGRFHNNLTHSILVGVAASLLFALSVQRWRKASFTGWFLLALLAYLGHIFMDASSISRGVMAFWPFTTERFLSPVTLFYGLHWSDGWLSARHLWTFFTEALFAVVLVVIVRLFGARRRAG